jgi:hypothetical protein
LVEDQSPLALASLIRILEVIDSDTQAAFVGLSPELQLYIAAVSLEFCRRNFRASGLQELPLVLRTYSLPSLLTRKGSSFIDNILTRLSDGSHVLLGEASKDLKDFVQGLAKKVWEESFAGLFPTAKVRFDLVLSAIKTPRDSCEWDNWKRKTLLKMVQKYEDFFFPRTTTNTKEEMDAPAELGV